MRLAKIKVTRTSQPQDWCGADRSNPITKTLVRLANAALVTDLTLTSGKLIDSANQSITYTSTDPGIAVNAGGKSLAKNKNVIWVGGIDSAETAIGTGDFTVAYVGVDASNNTSQYFCQLGPSMASAAGYTYFGDRATNLLAVNTFGGALAAVAGHVPGSLETVVMARRSGAFYFYRNGSFIGSANHSSNIPLLPFCLSSSSGASKDVNTAALFRSGLNHQQCLDLSGNFWQLFEPEDLTIWGPDAAGSGEVTLTGANATQINDSTNGAVTQTHALSGAAVAQTNIASTAAITQSHVLAGENSTQTNTGSTGAVGGSINLTGAAGSQSNTASTAAITQAHTLVGENGIQTSAAGVGAISQAHALTGENSTQTNLGSAAALGELTITLTGAAGSQSNSGTTGAIAQRHALAGAPGLQTNLASASAITQAHALSASNSAQVNLGSIGAIVVAGVTYWPAPEQVLAGVTYGPTGTEYVGTAAAGLIVAEAVNFVVDPDVVRLTIEPDTICLTVR